MAKAAAKAAMPVLLLNVGMGDLLAGGYGLSGVPGRETQFAAAFVETLEAAALLGSRFVHVGPSRIPPDVTRAECLGVLIENVRRAAPMARDAGLELLLEPLNCVDVPDILLPDPIEVAGLLRDRLRDDAAMMFDLYHVARAGLPIDLTFAECVDVVAHVQFSDCPGRREPGTGNIDFRSAFASLRAAGYRGWIGAEYAPSVNTAATLGWLELLR
jgi:hydroxypyruvate isomerase